MIMRFEGVSILIVDDDEDMKDFLVDLLRDEGYEVRGVSNGNEALEMIEGGSFNIVISDIRMPGLDGMTLLERAKELDITMPFFILITAFGDVEDTISMMDAGAYDFIIKPFKMEQILISVKKAVREIMMRKRIRELEELTNERYSLNNLIGKSPAMRRVFHLVERVSASDGNVLIEGETGTGKEILARTIHFLSPRRKGPFVAVNCAAIPEGLLESELFGFLRGAFTDAKSDRMGLFVEAEGGTLFLDEVAEMSPGLQAKLLRVLEEKKVRPLGSNRAVDVDVRFIAATNKNLRKEVESGRFREDLFYRVNIFRIELPPLRERKEDIPLLIQEFLRESGSGTRRLEIPPEVMRVLLDYSWPGNVRELKNVVERLSYLAEDGKVRLEDLPPEMLGKRDDALFSGVSERLMSLEEMEREYIKKVLEKCRGNKVKAAKILGIDRKTIYRKLGSE